MCSGLPAAERLLYSHLPRALALRLTCRKLAELVRAGPAAVGAAIGACRRAAEELQRPDPDRLEGLRSRVGTVGRQITFIMDNPGDTEADLRESQVKLGELRRRRQLQAELAVLEAARARPAIVPTKPKSETSWAASRRS